MRSILETHQHPDFPRLGIQLRARSKFYQAVTFLDGKKVQKSLKTKQLTTALKLGQEWYKRQLKSSVDVGRKHPLDKLTADPTIGELFTNYRLTLPPHRRDYVDIKWGAIGYFWRGFANAQGRDEREAGCR